MDNQEIDLRAILGVLRRRIKLIILTLVIILTVTAGITFSLKPEYTASTLVMVDPSRKDLLDPDGMSGMSSGSDSARVDSEVEIVRSVTTLMRVIEKENLLSDPEFQPRLGLRNQIMAFLRISEATLPTGEAALNAVLSNLRDAVSVQRRGLTYLVSINAQAASPETAARIANALANAHIEQQLYAKIQSVMASRDILQARIADASASVAAGESAFDGFIESNIERITAETGRQDIATMRALLENATAERARLSSTADAAVASLGQMDFEALSRTLQSDALATLEQQRTELENRLSGLENSSSAWVDLRAELDSLQNQFAAVAQSEIDRLRSDVQRAQVQATDLRNELRTTVISSDLPPDILTNLFELQQTSSLARTQYQTLLARVSELENQASLQVADSRIVSPATPPGSASFPNTRLIFTMATLLALGLGAGLAFIVENFVGGFASPEQLEAVTRREVGATIPHQRLSKRADGTEVMSAADMVTTAPLSQFAESIRRLRLRVDQAMLQSSAPAPTIGSMPAGRVIVVSSSLPMEGKTTTALALARTYSTAGLKVLLVDCDLRKPSLHRQLGVESSDGLFGFLSSGGDAAVIDTVTAADPLSEVSVIVGARHSDVPTEQLLTNKTFLRLIDAGRAVFDVVILDTPPVGVVVDGIYVAQLADAVVFVTRWSSTSQREVQNALASIDRAKAPGVPVVLALAQQPTMGRNYKSRYYAYYSEE